MLTKDVHWITSPAIPHSPPLLLTFRSVGGGKNGYRGKRSVIKLSAALKMTEINHLTFIMIQLLWFFSVLLPFLSCSTNRGLAAFADRTF